MLNIGIIPDGNRKYAAQKGISLASSYKEGAIVAKKIVREALARKDVGSIVFYALSKENYANRSSAEIQAILFGFGEAVKRFKKIEGLSMSCIGDTSTPELVKYFQSTQFSPRTSKLDVRFLFNYSHTWDFEGSPVQSAAVPAIDLVIRTNNQPHLSGFLPYQTAESRLYFTEGHWPEFTIDKFNHILEDYQNNWKRRIPGK